MLHYFCHLLGVLNYFENDFYCGKRHNDTINIAITATTKMGRILNTLLTRHYNPSWRSWCKTLIKAL